ncbi:MAG: hypothetical protein AAB320_08155 [Elusimicrobiota bacterium]
MMKLLLPLILIAATNGFAAEPPTTREQSQEKPKTQAGKPAKKASKVRSIKELIALAEKVGLPGKIDEVEFEALGFPGELSTKKLTYSLSPWPNFHQRRLAIVYDSSSKPIALAWKDEESTRKEGKEDIGSAWHYVSSLDGELQRSAYAYATADDADITAKEVSESVKRSYQTLVSFFKTESASLAPLEK